MGKLKTYVNMEVAGGILKQTGSFYEFSNQYWAWCNLKRNRKPERAILYEIWRKVTR